MSAQTITCTKCGRDLQPWLAAKKDDAVFRCCDGGAVIGPVMRNVMVKGGEALSRVSNAPISYQADDVIFKTIRFPARPDLEADGG